MMVVKLEMVVMIMMITSPIWSQQYYFFSCTLSRLLLFHGAWNSRSMSKMVGYFFYKSVAFYTVQLWSDH